MCTGNKGCEAFSELCFQDAERLGVGLSRFAEVMVQTIERLINCEHYQAVLKEDLFAAVQTEAERLLPSFRALHAGRGVAEPSSSSIRSLAYLAAPQDPGDLRPHVDAVHLWLSQQHSALRSVIALFSAGGLFYVAQCHDKGARAWVHHGGGDQEAMRAAVAARRPQREAAQNDLDGLSPPARR